MAFNAEISEFYDSGDYAHDTYWYPAIGMGFAYLSASDRFVFVNSTAGTRYYNIISHYAAFGNVGGSSAQYYSVAPYIARRMFDPAQSDIVTQGDMEFGLIHIADSVANLYAAPDMYRYEFIYISGTVVRMRVHRIYMPI